MSRVDRPTLQCDRCLEQTQDIIEMSRFNRLTHCHMSGTTEWDLCPLCWQAFQQLWTR